MGIVYVLLCVLSLVYYYFVQRRIPFTQSILVGHEVFCGFICEFSP